MRVLVLPSVSRPFVTALRQVADTAGTWSVIGGFAVWCHLGESHRPTIDIDTVAAAEAHETLVRLLQTADWDSLATDARQLDGLGEVVAWAATSVLVEQATRIRRLIRVHTDSVPSAPDYVRELGRLLGDHV